MVESQEACAKLSFSTQGALFWTYQPSTKLCWPKTSKAGRRVMEGVVSGNNECAKDGKGSPTQKKPVYIWALPKLQFDPPSCANPGTLWHNYFAENEKIL